MEENMIHNTDFLPMEDNIQRMVKWLLRTQYCMYKSEFSLSIFNKDKFVWYPKCC